MKNSNIIKGVAALTIMAATAGTASYALASNQGSVIGNGFGRFMQRQEAMTDTQKAEIETKLAAVKAAIEAGNYDAWVSATKAINENSPELKRITAANFSEYVANFKEREAERAERQAKIDAVKSAIASGDYTAWAAAEKALDENSPLLEKITADNFNRYVEATKLRDQAHAIMTELGIDRGEGRGMGMGEGMGFGKMHGGRGMMGITR